MESRVVNFIVLLTVSDSFVHVQQLKRILFRDYNVN